MTTELERAMKRLKDMGVTVTTTPAPGREAGFADRPMGRIQAEAERQGIAERRYRGPTRTGEPEAGHICDSYCHEDQHGVEWHSFSAAGIA
jgi:hypothetical protein